MLIRPGPIRGELTIVITVRSLGSGSSGNAILIDTGDCLVAVDCGIGSRALTNGLREANRTINDLDAVLLTHEHTDHVRALPRVVASQIPIVATAGTARATRLPIAGWTHIRGRTSMPLRSLEVTALSVSHDAAEPCGYHIRCQSHAITVLTDLGIGHPSLHDYLAESDLIVLEANHDEAMLRSGPYPAHLKRRVLSTSGHLSNEDCGSLLTSALPVNGRARTVWLAHLSTTNNRPGLAEAAVRTALRAHGRDDHVVALPRYSHEVAWHSVDAEPAPAQLRMDLTSLL
jgi:phosphoribosyl 1,2-cyclic phosphodiesterase